MIIDGLCSALDSLGRPYRRVDHLDAGHAWELRATTVMLVEPLPRVTAPASASERGLRAILSAANAPGVRRAIIVTPRPDADAELRAVRRAGIPYAILRPLPVVEQATAAEKPVLVTRELAGAPVAAVTPPPDMTWSELLARAGVRPKPVAAWRARVGRWFGARTFETTSVAAPA
jgi:hypothetical protein